MKIAVGFSTSEWWVSRVIRYFTKAACSHAFLLIEGTDLGDLVLEAEWCGWSLSTKEALTRGSTHIIDLIYPKVDLLPGTLTSLKWLHEKYNYEGLFGEAWVSICARFGKRVRNPLRNSKSMFCSEAIVYLLQHADYPGADALDPQSVSPADLRGFMRKQEGLA
jgi:hypothetical protein